MENKVYFDTLPSESLNVYVSTFYCLIELKSNSESSSENRNSDLSLNLISMR